MGDNTNFTRDYIEAAFKLSERDRLRERFIMGDAPPPDFFGYLHHTDSFLAELLADPEKAATAAPFFPAVLNLASPPDLSASSEALEAKLFPWGGNPAAPAYAAGSPPDDGLSLDDRQILMDYQGRTAALLMGAAISGAAPFFEPFMYRKAWDGRPINLIEGDQADMSGPAIQIPKKANRVLVFGFVRSPKIMGMNPGLSKLRPAAGWLDWPEQIAAALKMADFLASMGYIALPSAGGLVMADHLGAIAGLGEVGRQGLLITPDYGPNLRLFTIITDYPFTVDSPHSFGVADYCETCQRCINECPAKAISEGRRRPGLYKWPLNRRACFDNWLEKRDPCMKCIEICPYTREPLVGSSGGNKA